MISEAASALQSGSVLTEEQARQMTLDILEGRAQDGQIQLVLGALADRGETDEELYGMLDAMRRKGVRADIGAQGAIDVCGTGGDGKQTVNVSTAAAFVVAAAGGRVAKHGNRSSSGGTGSADILEALGCSLSAGPAEAAESLRELGVCFMFAPQYNPGMRHAAAARRALARRTAFNILGPLCNPAGVRRQLVGVSSEALLERVPAILCRGGSEMAMSVMSCSGMDELSTASANHVCLGQDGAISRDMIRPEDVGLHRAEERELAAGKSALAAFVSALEGRSSRAISETVALNAGAGLVLCGKADGISGGTASALDAIGSGRASKLLHAFVARHGDAAKLEEAAADG